MTNTYVIEDSSLLTYDVRAYSHVISQLVCNHEPIGLVFGATAVGMDLAPRVARKLGGSVISNCKALEVGEGGRLTARKSIYGGNVDATFVSLAEPFVVTIDQKLFELDTGKNGHATFVKEIEVDLVTFLPPCESLGRIDADPKDLDISEAEIVIGLGRGINNVAQLEMIEELAHLLRAGIGGTRPAVDDGWVTPQRQIGVSGKDISPNLYLACGVSGAPHHLAGVKESKHIVAINTDKAAPIFKVADLGVVGRVEEIIPLLINQIKNRQAQEKIEN